MEEHRNYSNFNMPDDTYHETDIHFYSPEELRLGAIFNIVFTTFGMIGNFISLIALLRYKKIQSATTAFIMNLTTIDFLHCSFILPMHAVMFIEEKLPFTISMCKLVAFVDSMNGIVSMYTILAIAICRFVLIVYPAYYAFLYEASNIAVMITVLWSLSLMLLLLPLFGIWGIFGYDPIGLRCTIKTNPDECPFQLFFISFILVSTILFISYVKVFLVVRKTNKKTQRKEDKSSTKSKRYQFGRSKRQSKIWEVYGYLRGGNEPRLLLVITLVFLSFVFRHFPIMLYRILDMENSSLYLFCELCYDFSSVINPVIYIVLGKEYRIAYKNLFVKKTSRLNMTFHSRNQKQVSQQEGMESKMQVNHGVNASK